MNKLLGNVNKRKLALIVAALVILTAAISGWFSVRQTTLNPLSEDAVIGSSVVHITSSVPGRIISLNVQENSKVQKGDLLFTIDPDLYRLRVEQARAEVKIAEAALDTQNRTVLAEQSNAAVTNEQIVRAQANLKLATQTLSRLQPLLAKGYVTAQQVDDAVTARHDAEISLKQALKQSSAAEALISSTAAAEALLAARRAALAIAERELANTQIRAPHNGRVVGLNVSAGEFVISDQAIFTLINTEEWHASAFFRETELDNIKVGNCATVYVMASPKRAIQGRVAGVGWGVTTEDLLNIPRGLPYVPKSLNWVRVVQRFPVRISLDNPPEDLMRMGATAVVVVRNDHDC
ncbi:multidrug transporter subunit MdtN [Serratia sp. UGAL515B_01]|uniref:multidrug transporter subunit MdtN n=1 Tax=Serratia sp. UGAL515B_01 TaxID=2986763 RepID=UPI002953DF0F|nr:multidrug transporter subunit MdtN [Serratia sp. UGAL515B_01]WON78909.1 multidrug transporter subunit MdtN [Serratia sp. UGAL515B_01]